jgi:hypothetical protein
MKRTGFKKKAYPWRRTPKKEGIIVYKETKDEEWARIKREELDPYFYRHNLHDICELQLRVCTGRARHYAHSKKRDDIARDEPERTRELKEVVRACPECHDFIEYPPRTEDNSGKRMMYEVVVDRIKKREARLERWK